MANNLVIVESPAKAKTIKKYLGSGYQVIASMGHVRDLPKSQIGVDIEHDFTPKYITIRGKGDLIAKLKKEAKSAKKIYLATDPDREGEAISWHLAKLFNIEEHAKCRIAFNEITKSAVQKAIKSPREINENLVNAQQTRRILDRIVGYKISPLLWKKVRKGLSAGRVQSVATKLIVDREREIEAFESEEYWTIDLKLQKTDTEEVYTARFYGDDNGKIALQSDADTKAVLEKIENSEFIITDVKTGKKKRSPAPPFITSTLQQEAARKLSFTTKKTMQIAQQLYEGIDVKGIGTVGLITYMRTDSLRISDEARLAVTAYIKKQYGDTYAPDTPRVYKSKKSAQDAHEAIRPSNMELIPVKIKESLSRDQYKLYKLIWERFVAAHMNDALLEVINADIKSAGYLFKASGSAVLFDGFMKLYVEGNDQKDEKEEANESSMLPPLKIGETAKLLKADDRQHFTQPPSRYTEASLIKALEEKEIGRPSTYAPTIITITTRGYVVKEGKSLVPTELGKITTDILSQYFENIVDVKFTANMEKDLDKIEEGSEDWVLMLKKFYPPFEEVLHKAEEDIGEVEIKDEVSDVICEKCGRNMVVKQGRYGKFLACPGFPDCRNAKPIVEETGVNCPKCGGRILAKKSRTGKRFYGCENNPACDFMSWDEPLTETCPNCGSNLYRKRQKWGTKIVCQKEGCGYERSEKK